MITAVHIEDEPRNIELLGSLINVNYPGVIQMESSATNVHDAYFLIKKVKPQLVFLDIELNRGNAFELLEKLSNSIGIHFQVIFITAFNEYAVKAFRLNAIDYILKPISTEELKQAVNKAIERINNTHTDNGYLGELLKELQGNVSNKKIGISVAEGVDFYNSDDIIKIEAKGSYSIFYISPAKKITSTRGMKDVEELLPGSFLRVHNAWIINTKHLKKYVKGRNGFLEMDDGTNVPISVRKKGSLLDRL
ncbi:MAG: LytTR family DNA-binding domain-containing protein [Ferruginibacter sp.]